MKAVLVTGVGGFLGQQMVHEFHERGWRVLGVGTTAPPPAARAKLTHFWPLKLPCPRLKFILRVFAPELVVHCAGRAAVGPSFADPADDFRSGPGVLFEVLDNVRTDSPGSAAVFLSSAAVYGSPRVSPLPETLEPAPVSPYGCHKLLGESICAEFSRLFGVRTASARVFSAYGPGLRKQVLWDLCRKLTAHEPVVLQGTGEESRDFIHGRDVAAAVGAIAARGPLAGEVYNVGTGRATPIREVAERVAALLAPGARLSFDGNLPAGTPGRYQADVTRLGAVGFLTRISLEAGLADYVTWYKQEFHGQWRKQSA